MNNLHSIKTRAREGHHTKPILEKFFLHIQVAASGCWIWKNPQKDGRCQFYDGERQLTTHTWAYRFFKRRPLPPGFILVTTCGDPLCVTPWHLKLQKAGGESHGRGPQQLAKTHCPHDHPYDEVNSYHYINALGHPARNCKTCMRERDRKRQENKKIIKYITADLTPIRRRVG